MVNLMYVFLTSFFLKLEKKIVDTKEEMSILAIGEGYEIEICL